MGFTLGGFRELDDPDVRLMPWRSTPTDRVTAVTSWLPVYELGVLAGYTLDVMRRGDDGMPGRRRVPHRPDRPAVARGRADGR